MPHCLMLENSCLGLGIFRSEALRLGPDAFGLAESTSLKQPLLCPQSQVPLSATTFQLLHIYPYRPKASRASCLQARVTGVSTFQVQLPFGSPLFCNSDIAHLAYITFSICQVSSLWRLLSPQYFTPMFDGGLWVCYG